MDGDRERWNAKWRERAGELETQAPFLTEHADLLPSRGKALDVAGGAGRNAIWLARRGLDVTLVDVSDVALHKAEAKATAAGVASRMRFLRLDLDADHGLAPLYDLVVMYDYLNRERRDELAALLHEGGVVVAVQATMTNLERHPSPSHRFLVKPGELEQWARTLGMEVLVAREGWTDGGRHEAAVIARRSAVPIEIDDKIEESGPSQGPYR